MARLPTPSPSARWILTIVITAALLGGGYYYWDKYKDEQAELLPAIAQAQQTIDQFRDIDTAQYEREISDLESRLKSAEMRRLVVEQKLREHTHSIEIEEVLYERADESMVTLYEVTCSNPEAREIGGVRFEVYHLGVNAGSEVPPQLINYVQKLSATFPDATINHLDMTFPTRGEDGALQGPSGLSLGMTVYYTTEQES